MHPERACLDVKVIVGRGVDVLPQVKSPFDHLGVDTIRSVDGADDACSSSRARQRIARTPPVKEDDLGAETTELQRRPASERASADDGHARLFRGEERLDVEAAHQWSRRDACQKCSPGKSSQKLTRVLTPIVRGWLVRNATRARSPRSLSSDRYAVSL